MKKEMRSARLLAVALTLGLLPPAAVAAEVHQATGFKVVNVTSAAADIWTRVTLRSAANPADAPLPRVEAFEAKTGKPVALRENRTFPDTRITVHMPPGLDLGAAAGAPAATGPDPEHRFLRTGQGGFLSGVVTPTATGASLELRLHDVDGRVVYREQK